jgi:hypothetical protein
MDAMLFLGPITNVTLSRPLLAPEDIRQASSIQIKMLVDTGASKTVVDRLAAQRRGRRRANAAILHVAPAATAAAACWAAAMGLDLPHGTSEPI